MSENPAKPASETEQSVSDASPMRAMHDRQIFGYLRNIRAATQYLQRRIADALQQSAALPAGQRQDYIKGVLSDPLLHRVSAKIDKQLVAIEDIFAADAVELEWGADEVTTIELIWAEVKESLATPIAANDSAEQHLKPAQNDLDRIVFYCESLTLSPRINDILPNLRVGQPLDIDFAFSEEFPQDAQLRKRLIEELAQQSFVLKGGVVDADQGIVYKTALTRCGQLMSLWQLLAVLLLGFLLPYALAFGGKVFSGWPFQPVSLDALLANYVMILLGSGAHLAVESLKAAKKQARPSFHALHDWVLWVHVRQAPIFKGIAYIWTGYLLLSFGFRDMNWSLAFFAGYSIDSVTELFLGRFEATVAAETKLLTKV
jgi:hypothetical protein